jgi:hypothetical protein
MNELCKPRPVLLIQTGNVAPVDVGQIGFNHRKGAPLLLQSRTSEILQSTIKRQKSVWFPPAVRRAVTSSQALRMGQQESFHDVCSVRILAINSVEHCTIA